MTSERLPWWVLVGTGFSVGVVIAVVTRLAETSNVSLGPYSLSGNGALAIPAILIPVAIFFGWTLIWHRLQTWRWSKALLFLLGVHLGFSTLPLVSLGAERFQPAYLPLLFLGPFSLLFIIPPTVFAAITIWLFTSEKLSATPTVLAAFIVGGFLAGLLPPFGLGTSGIIVGAGVVLAKSLGSTTATASLGAGIAVLLVLQAFALPLLLLLGR